jgi:hypothetical protein
MTPIYYSSALLLYKDYYFQAFSRLKEAVVYQLNFYGNCPQDSLWGVENMFKNLNEIIEHPGINMLKGKFKGKPGIVAGSGPSLKKVIHLLGDLKEKVVMISAESTLRALIHHGLKPNMVCSLERTDMTIRSFEGFDDGELQDVYLAGCPVIPRGAYEVYKGPRVVVYRRFDHFTWLQLDKGNDGN